MNIEDIISRLLESRGITSPQQVKDFFSPLHPSKYSLRELKVSREEVDKAVHLIKQHQEAGDKIFVYGDYDVDGITGTAILWEALHKNYPHVLPHIPHRASEGYGLSIAGLDHCLSQGAKLIITIDNGITAVSQVEYCKSRGCDLIIIDHHEIGPALPAADAIVHTTATSAAGLAWYFTASLPGGADNTHLALVALSVICDLIPLLGVNRSLAKYGLVELNHTRRPGLLALFAAAALTPGTIEAYHVGFVIGPRINAMGRLEHALDSLRLLCTTDPVKASQLAQILDETNRSRQDLTMSSFLTAQSSFAGSELPKLLIAASPDYSPGIIGLIAAKLVEKYHHPAIAISVGETESKASARSVPGFHITHHLQSASHLLVSVGGHEMAAGFTVQTARLPELTQFLVSTAETAISPDLLVKKYRIDAEIPLNTVSFELYRRLAEFAPFGLGNPQPTFSSREISLSGFKRIGKSGQHLKFSAGPHSAIAFNNPVQPQDTADIIYTVGVNTWNGRDTLQLVVKDIGSRV